MACSSLQLNCFNGKGFFYFLGKTVLIPYLAYHVVAKLFNWTRMKKRSLSQHYETMITALSSMSILWFLGNYEETFDSTTATFCVIGILLFGFVVEELPATHAHTLATMHHWNGDMYKVVIVTLGVMAAFAVHHVHLAKEVSPEFARNYILAGVIPIVLAVLARKVVDVDNGALQQNSMPKRMLFHLHHVHLFYAIAFYTRFPEFWSRVAAGLAIGASLHGAAAFGYDPSFYAG